MEAVLIIAITMLMSSGAGEGFMDLELRIPQKDIQICEEAKNAIGIHTYTNNPEYRDEYRFKLREAWCVVKQPGPKDVPIEHPALDK